MSKEIILYSGFGSGVLATAQRTSPLNTSEITTNETDFRTVDSCKNSKDEG